MKTLSIRNPWAYLVAFGVKDVENRYWKTDYRGRILIHASGNPWDWPDTGDIPKEVYEILLERFEDGINMKTCSDSELPIVQKWWSLQRWAAERVGVNAMEPDNKKFWTELRSAIYKKGFPMPAQAIIGVVDIVDIVRDSKSPFAMDGYFHWILKNAEYFENPIVGVKGRLRFWEYGLPSM